MKKKRLLALLLAGALAAQSGAALAAEIDISDSEDAAQEFVIGDDEQEEEVVTPAEENTEEEINVQDIEVVDAITVNANSAVKVGTSSLTSGTYYKLNETGTRVVAGSENDYQIYCEVIEDTTYLTLNNAELNTYVSVPGNTVVKVVGKNSITIATSGLSGIQVSDEGSLTLEGNGTLSITTSSYVINQSYGDATIKGSVGLTLETDKYAIRVKNGNLYVAGNATVESTGTKQPAISCSPGSSDSGGSILISDSARVTAATEIMAEKPGKVIAQDNAYLNVKSSTDYAIQGYSGVEILGQAEVIAEGKLGGIRSTGGSVIIEGEAEATATDSAAAAVSVGLNTQYDITVTGTLKTKGAIGLSTGYGNIIIKENANVDVLEANTGLWSKNGAIQISNATITIVAESYGIYDENKNNVIEITNADVSVKAGTCGIYLAAGVGAKGVIKVTESVVTVSSKKPFSKQPTVVFENGPEVVAGNSETDFSLIAQADLKNTVYTTQNQYVKIQPHNNHKLTKVAAVDATCEQTGTIEHYICKVCDKLFADEQGTKEIDSSNIDTDKVEHSPAAAVRENEVAATCTKDGSYDKVVYCSVGKEELSRETKTVKALGHDYSDWTTTKAATCTEKGTEQRVCKNDETHVETREIEEIAHSPAAAVRENEVAATCTKDGSYDEVVYCADCGQEMSRETKTVKALGHDYGSWTTTKSATCTEKGTEQRVCKNDKTHVETREIQATGHDYGEWTVTTEATCTKAGAETRICKNDKTHTETREIAKLAHNYKTTTTKAQPGKNGSTVTKCTVCGDVKSTTTISAPKTVTLSKTSYTYSGKAKKPTVTVKDANGKKIASSNYTVSYASGRKNIGTYKVTVKFKGTKYTGSLTKSFTINPKAAKIKQASNLVKGFKVTWSKTSNITGYQIQYATGKSFKNAKTVTASKSATSKKITGLKTGSISKKYYVRVRTYKTVNGKKYYSSWSSVKSAHAVRYSK